MLDGVYGTFQFQHEHQPSSPTQGEKHVNYDAERTNEVTLERDHPNRKMQFCSTHYVIQIRLF